ncbi:Hypothetical protein A7982_13078 [Minicystis rosea]|nr:Hypothetical protein A7982_13078 [Minicystis rosea]
MLERSPRVRTTKRPSQRCELETSWTRARPIPYPARVSLAEHGAMDEAAPRSPVLVHAFGPVIEGVEIRSPHFRVAVCRSHDGMLRAARSPVDPLDAGAGAWPFLRGVVIQVRQWNQTVSFHQWSFAHAEGTAPPPTKRSRTYQLPPTENDPAIASREELLGKPPSWSPGPMVKVLVIAAVWMGVAQLVADQVLSLAGASLDVRSFPFQIVTVILQAVLLVVYLRMVGRMPDVRRVMQYNTAAFHTLVAHETNTPLTVAAVHRQSPFHPRSGGSYLGVALALFPFVFYLAGRPLVGFTGSPTALHATFLALKLATLPVVGALSFELTHLAGRLFQAGKLRGAWPIVGVLQRATMVEPDAAQIETAILAMREVRALEAEWESHERTRDA